MRIAALYDVHGNLPALEAVLAEVEREQVDAIVVGGDFVGPLDTLGRLRRLGDRAYFLHGNLERELVTPSGTVPAGRPTEILDGLRSRLSPDERVFLAGLPEQVRLGRTLFCHATVHNDVDIVTELTPDARFAEAFAAADTDLVVCGHTHMQFDRTAVGVRVVNAGSVGMPYEDEPGAFWALLGEEVELRRTEYDVAAAVAAIAATGFPGEWPSLSRAEAAAQFESMAGA